MLARAEVGAVRTRIYNGKNYQNVWWKNPTYSTTVGDSYVGTKLVPAGTVWTATHWNFMWRPQDATNWHAEIAVRAANLATLKTLYPNT